ncbi:MAG: amino acid ABC transporter substrate-binding protein [Firmicutes bacterium]|nr:amino acid ABC transporter substrate-binding protein [Bacillota bacterium]
MKKRLCLLLALIMLFSVFAAACGGDGNEEPEGDTAADTSLEAIQEKGELILGLDDSFLPMGFKDENGEIVGFDIDVAREVCAILGVELKLQPIDWNSKEMELNTGNIDCIWNGMSVSPEREEAMSLSIPYLDNHMALVVLPDSGIATVGDMAGKNLAVQTGSTAEEALDAPEGADLKNAVASVNGFADNLTALMDLETGASDAVLIDDVVANYLIATSGKNMVVLNDFLYAENYAIGFRKDDVALTEAVNGALRELKANGKLAEIATKWFGSDTTIVE